MIAAVVAVVALAFGGWILYATVINDPADELTTADLQQRLDDNGTPDTGTPETGTPDTAATDTGTPDTGTPDTAAPDTAGSATTDGGYDGAWRITTGSEVGYRVAETLGGVATEGVGRTGQVEGGIEITGTTITEATFTVDVASIRSDSSRRDEQFAGRIMETDLYPTASFVLTTPIDIGTIPPEGQDVSLTATGDLTLHGVTKAVMFDLTARVDNGRVGVLASIPVVFADFGIANPSFGPVQTGDEGELEVLLVLDRA